MGGKSTACEFCGKVASWPMCKACSVSYERVVSDRRFRVMGGPSVPWRLVEPYEAQALANHDQTLKRLNERGGLSPGELWCVVHGKHWREMPTDDAALAWLKAWLENDVVELIAKFIEKHPDVAPLELVIRIRNGEWWQ